MLDIEPLVYFMQERHRIYQRRAAGQPAPWTEDPILRDNRFCNVFRELDTVTVWIRENIRERFADHPYLWFMLAIARYINWPPTLQFLMECASGDHLASWPNHSKFDCGEKFRERAPKWSKGSDLAWGLHTRAVQSQKVYTGAYMIRAESDPLKPWYSWSKHEYIADVVLGRLWEDRQVIGEFLETPGRSLEEAWAFFQQPRYVGWGPFMAYEVVTDLRHTRYLREAPDIMLWANAGPGAIRGLNRLHGRPLKTHPPAAQTNAEMQELLHILNQLDRFEFTKTFGPIGIQRFEMRDVEHSLCEGDKYLRVKSGDGKMRSKYNGRKQVGG